MLFILLGVRLLTVPRSDCSCLDTAMVALRTVAFLFNLHHPPALLLNGEGAKEKNYDRYHTFIEIL
jgi:hypothetical protein